MTDNLDCVTPQNDVIFKMIFADPKLKEASDIFEAAKADPEKRRLIQEREDAVRNYNNAISAAIEEEQAKAEQKLAEERAKAEQKLADELEKAERKAEAEKHAEKIETAKKLMIAGVSVEIIASSTGMSAEDIIKLQ